MFQLVWEDVKSHWCSSSIPTFVGSNAKFQFRLLLYYTTNRLKLLLNRSCLMAENTTGTPSFARRGASVKLRYSSLHAYHILSRCLHSVALLRSNDSLVSAASFPFGSSWFTCWPIFRKKANEPFWYYTSSSPGQIVHDMMYFSAHFFLGIPAWSSGHEHKRWHEEFVFSCGLRVSSWDAVERERYWVACEACATPMKRYETCITSMKRA